MHEARLPNDRPPQPMWPPPGSGLTRHTITIGGRQMSYVTGGQGPAVLLLHGIGASSVAWRYTLPALLPHFTVYAPDMFGCGESDKPAMDYSVPALAGSIMAFMAAVGLEHAHVIGHSLGGGLALQLTQLCPERIDRLTLVASGGMGRELHWMLRLTTLPGAGGVLGVLAHPRTRLAHASRMMERRRMRRLRVDFDPNVPTVLDRLRARDSRQAFLRMLRSVSNLSGQKMSALPHLSALTMPVLIIWGARDRTIPVAHAQLALAALPCAHLEVLDQCFHRPQLEAPTAFNAAVLVFLRASAWPPSATTAHRVNVAPGRKRRVNMRAWRTIAPAFALAAIGSAAGVRLVRRPLRRAR